MNREQMRALMGIAQRPSATRLSGFDTEELLWITTALGWAIDNSNEGNDPRLHRLFGEACDALLSVQATYEN